MLTRREVFYYILLGMFLQLSFDASHKYLYKIAKRAWLINDSQLHLAPKSNQSK